MSSQTPTTSGSLTQDLVALQNAQTQTAHDQATLAGLQTQVTNLETQITAAQQTVTADEAAEQAACDAVVADMLAEGYVLKVNGTQVYPAPTAPAAS